MSAVNSHGLGYNPTAIPLLIGFEQFIIANFDAFIYLSLHNGIGDIGLFLKDPNRYLEERGVKVLVPFDDMTAKIFAAIVEDEMLEALKSKECDEVWVITSSYRDNPWKSRHPERYPASFMKNRYIYGLSIPYRLEKEQIERHGYPEEFSLAILCLSRYFSE